ncbi:SDR family oxidoreductase [Nocardioides bigeumensis]|uniref:SDR family oxidoreductase n=1 Tax=Nocardioides bigeumensis TaxID=433657 RepID=A0ABP5KB56_9ACTN
MRSLDGKVVVITGAASGIGRALAVEAAARGALLALSDVDEAGLARTAQACAGTREVRADRVDVADRAAMFAYAADVAAHFGRVNVLVNNAGVALHGDLEDLEYADLDWIVGVNFWGVLHGTKEFLPHLIASGDGHLVTLSSLYGLLSMPGQSAYNATKYAVRGMTEAVREELLIAGHPVGVTVVHPGGIKTAIARSARTSAKVDHDAAARLFDEKLATMPPEKAARIIWRGVLRGKPRVLVGMDAHLIHQFARLTGARYQDVVARVHRGLGDRIERS